MTLYQVYFSGELLDVLVKRCRIAEYTAAASSMIVLRTKPGHILLRFEGSVPGRLTSENRRVQIKELNNLDEAARACGLPSAAVVEHWLEFFGQAQSDLLRIQRVCEFQAPKLCEAALNMMIIFGLRARAGKLRTYIGFRSHAEAMISAADEPGPTRGKLETLFQDRAARLVSAIRTADRRCAGGTAREPPIGSFSEYCSVVDLVMKFGSLSRHVASSGERRPERRKIETSRFHTILSQNAELVEFMENSERFAALRSQFQHLYGTTLRLGIPTHRRGLLCYLVARGFEEAFGVDAESAIRNFSRTQL